MRSHRCDTPIVSNYEKLRDRLGWVLRNRVATATGEKMNKSTWSLAAGKARQQVATMMSDPRRTTAKAPTLTGLAWAGQVSLRWLSSGEGNPNDDDVPEKPAVDPTEVDASKLIGRPWSTFPGWNDVAAQTVERHPSLDIYVHGAGTLKIDGIPRGGLTVPIVERLALHFGDVATEKQIDKAARALHLERAAKLENPSSSMPSSRPSGLRG